MEKHTDGMERIPAYRRHKASGNAIVVLSGRMHYLGQFDTAASREKYQQLVDHWVANGRRALPKDAIGRVGITVRQLVTLFMAYAETYYPKREGTREASNFDYATRPMIRLFGDLPTSSFRVSHLRQVRDAMVEHGYSRTVINRHLKRIRMVFKWAHAERDLVTIETVTSLSTLPPLRRGRSQAKEPQPVRPPDRRHVEHAIPFMVKPVAAMVRLQLLTGMRPGEVTKMTAGEIDMAGEVWFYSPRQHKTQHHGLHRTIGLGPRSQLILQLWLTGDPNAYLFSPAAARPDRKTGERLPGDHYKVTAYTASIKRGCRAAGLERPLWFSANQLRHLYATELRQRAGLEAVQVALGHQSIKTTEIYAEPDTRLLEQIAQAAG